MAALIAIGGAAFVSALFCSGSSASAAANSNVFSGAPAQAPAQAPAPAPALVSKETKMVSASFKLYDDCQSSNVVHSFMLQGPMTQAAFDSVLYKLNDPKAQIAGIETKNVIVNGSYIEMGNGLEFGKKDNLRYETDQKISFCTPSNDKIRYTNISLFAQPKTYG